MIRPGYTRHQLSFDKLSPDEFERLCLWLVTRGGWERAEHLGAAGSDKGQDIVAWRGGERWAFQCKRVQHFYPHDALTEVEKVLSLPGDERPSVLVFIVSCNVAHSTRQKARARCRAASVECHFWVGTELDYKVKEDQVILQEFFGPCHDITVIHQHLPGLEDYVYDFRETIDAVTQSFVGREFVFEALDTFIQGNPCGYFRIIAEAGLGKTALAAEIAKRYQAIPHFINAKMGITRPDQCLNHLSACLIARYALDYDHLPARAGEDSSFLLRLLREAAEEGAARPSVLLVIDGLDEADPVPPGRNWMHLPDRLPTGVYTVLVHRPGDYRLSTDPRLMVEKMEILWDDPRHQADIREYLEQQAKRSEIREVLRSAVPAVSTYQFVEALQPRSEGSFMYLDHVLEDIARQESGFDPLHLDELPQGLMEYYGRFWDSIKEVKIEEGWDSWCGLYRRVIELLGAAAEPVTATWLEDHTGHDAQEIASRALERWRRFVRMEYRGDREAWRVIHGSFTDFLARKVDLRRVHHLIAHRYLEAWVGSDVDSSELQIPERRSPSASYGLRHLIHHLSEAQEADQLAPLLTNFNWLQEKLDVTDVNALLTDYDLALSHSKDRALQLIQAAIRAAAHVLKRDKTQLWTQLHGRLMAHDLPGIQEMLSNPPAAPWLRTVVPSLPQAGGALLRTLTTHSASSDVVVVASDERRVISVSQEESGDELLIVWDLERGVQRRSLPCDGRVNALALMPDGSHAVLASSDETLKVWDLRREIELQTLRGHTAAVRAVAMRNERQVVSASDDKTIRLWDLECGNTLCTLKGHRGPVWAVAVTTDGRRAVSASADGTLMVWNLEYEAELCTLEGHTDSVWSVAMTSDGRRAVSASSDKTLRVWDLERCQQEHILKGHTESVWSVAMSPDGQRAVSASADRSLKVWDLEGGKELGTLNGHTQDVIGVTTAREGKRAISASRDGTIRIWDIRDASLESDLELPRLNGHSQQVNALTLTNDPRRAISASHDRSLKVWRLPCQQQAKLDPLTLRKHRESVSAIAVTPNGLRAISGDETGALVIWNLSDPESEPGRVLHAISGHEEAINALAVTPDGQRVVSVSNDETVRVWDLECGNEIRSLHTHRGFVKAVAISPDGRFAVSASSDETLKVWDILSGTERHTLEGHEGFVEAVAVTPDGRRVVSASRDQTLRIWDIECGTELRTLKGHEDRVVATAITPDGQAAVSASWDQTLRVWDLQSGLHRQTLEGHTAWIEALAVTVDGQYVVSASRDRSLRVWNLDSGTSIATFIAEDALRACAVAGDSRTIVVGGTSGQVHILRLEGIE